MEELKKSQTELLEERVEKLKQENEQLKRIRLCMKIGGEKLMPRIWN